MTTSDELIDIGDLCLSPKVVDVAIRKLPDIKVCPFCGGSCSLVNSSKKKTEEDYVIHIANGYRVGCKRCEIFTPEITSDISQDEKGNIHVKHDGAREAISMWNERFDPKSILNNEIDKDSYFTNTTINHKE